MYFLRCLEGLQHNRFIWCFARRNEIICHLQSCRCHVVTQREPAAASGVCSAKAENKNTRTANRASTSLADTRLTLQQNKAAAEQFKATENNSLNWEARRYSGPNWIWWGSSAVCYPSQRSTKWIDFSLLRCSTPQVSTVSQAVSCEPEVNRNNGNKRHIAMRCSLLSSAL